MSEAGDLVVLPDHPYRAGAPHEIVAVARRWLGGSTGVFFAPHVPPLEESGARGAHGAYLLESEPVLVLYDATLLGTGENGFVVTSSRLCWKNLLDHPRQIAWGELDPQGISSRIGRVDLAGGSMMVSGELSSLVAGFLGEMASRARPERGGPYRRSSTSTSASPEEDEEAAVARLVTLARKRLGEERNLHYDPAIPPRKLRKARAMHAAHLPPGEEVAVLHDDTLFGDAEEGFLLTRRRFCWKNLSGDAASLTWDALDPESVTAMGNLIHLGARGAHAAPGAVHFTTKGPLVRRVAELLAFMARAVGSRT